MERLSKVASQFKQKQDLILYIHGFAASGMANKAIILKKYFGEQNVFSPTLPVNPELAIHTLQQNIELLKNHYNITLIGSSLGGFYSIYLAEKYNMRAILVNPAVEPYVTIKMGLNMKHYNFDGSYYTVSESIIEQYKKFEVEKKKLQSDKLKNNFLVLLTTGDNILDYRQAQNLFQNSQLDIYNGGNHEYDNFSEKMELINKFLNETK